MTTTQAWRARHRAGGVARGPGLLSVAGFASIGAGAIHATAAGMHNDHRQALWAFIGVALFQIGWGALVLLGPGARLALVGVLGNSAALGGWLLAKTAGIGFVDGLETAENVQLADAVAAGLAGIAVLAGLVAAFGLFGGAQRLSSTAISGFALVTVALTLPAMVSTGEHRHAADHHDGSESAGDTAAHAHGGEQADGLPRPFDPTQPIDLSGVQGVTPEQQARAENLLAITLIRLPKWADSAVAEAAGYHSIGDSATGYEHLINWSLLDDGRILDPDYPESLVYRVDGAGNRTLEAAMFMLQPGASLGTAPDIGGPLTQFHIHDDLCFTDDPVAPQVATIVPSGADCPVPLVKLEPVPMIHVWIVPHQCGPFAALEGVGAGQIADDEERACDHAHGST